MYGVGAWHKSIMVDGTTGTNVCCQWKGKSAACRPSTHAESLLTNIWIQKLIKQKNILYKDKDKVKQKRNVVYVTT